jgi:transcriptional regulator with XRE-family HTH domain
MNYANWLGCRMAERHLSQRQLAFRAGVDHATVSRTLAGRMPTVRTLSRLSRILGWPPVETLDPTAPTG